MITLKLTDAQARAVMDACDLYSRIAMGQWHDVRYNCHTKDQTGDIGATDYHLEMAAKSFLKLRATSGAFYGIRHPAIHVDAQRACDVYHVMRYAVAMHNNPTPTSAQKFGSVVYDAPAGYANETLPICEVKP